MKKVVLIGQIITAVLLTACILIQSKGGGLGSTWGKTGESYHSKRGMEKIVFTLTIILAALFLILSIINVI